MLDNDDKNLIREKFTKFDLSDTDIEFITQNTNSREFASGLVLYSDKNSCYGFVIVKSGALRAFILSQNAKEITIFTLKKGDECMLCSTCANENLKSEINLEAKGDLKVLVIAPTAFATMREKYPKLAEFTLAIISRRFAQSMDAMSSALFTPLQERLERYLIENSQNNKIYKTHEQIARDLGSAREVISRTLKEMSNIGKIRLERGKIILL